MTRWQESDLNKRGVQKMPVKRRRDEDLLQMATKVMLDMCFPAVTATHPANEGRSPQEGAKYKKMGVRAGASDWLLWWPHRGAGVIELKIAGNYPTASQHGFMGAIHACGFRMSVCYSVQEMYDTLISWGVPCAGKYIKEPDLTAKSQKIQNAIDMWMP